MIISSKFIDINQYKLADELFHHLTLDSKCIENTTLLFAGYTEALRKLNSLNQADNRKSIVCIG